MTAWKGFGASVIGPGHLARGKPNQDAWRIFHYAWGDGIAVSDGLGSKPFSDRGSKAACGAVIRAARACCGKSEIGNAFLSDLVKRKWLSLVAPREPSDCAATCLFAFRLGDGVLRMGMLGDGLVSAVRNNGSVVSLFDDKSESFSNITVALSPNVTEKDWRWLSLAEGDCQSVVLCTDGVADDLRDAAGFVKEFVGAHRDLSTEAAARHARKVLANWPTPRHRDDKTIACLFREEVADE